MPDHAEPSSGKIPTEALPRSEEGRLDWLQLFRSPRVGPTTFIRLIRAHGSASAALEALPEIAARSGSRYYALASRSSVETEWEAAMEASAFPLLLGAEDYPALLATISDAPPLLWAIGNPQLLNQPQVGLVGARNASALGCRMAARLASELGQIGYGIVSGLARGVDAAAHRAALETGTIAVQAGGVDTIYPPSNAELARQIPESGLRLSEMPMGHEPRAKDFPRRNRIISGIAQGIVVIEGALRSGSLITARNALDQGREVMAVPGSPLDPRAGGCNQLIRDGAVLVRSGEDVAETLAQGAPASPRYTPSAEPEKTVPRSIESPQSPPKAAPSTPPEPAGILTLLGPVPIPEHALARELGQSAARLAAELTDLELSGLIRRHPGGLISLA
ncbi:DNA-processing protein DprA [Amaricoccus macauensis]|uniref:DNA-processing protein DprA n=1 Tax=Amaricoccus macauensis TaxID=57001 RepID=UPI003C7D0412